MFYFVRQWKDPHKWQVKVQHKYVQILLSQSLKNPRLAPGISIIGDLGDTIINEVIGNFLPIETVSLTYSPAKKYPDDLLCMK